MLIRNYALASKISIGDAEEKDLNLAVNSSFYLKYSRFTLKALNKKVFQEFLSDMLRIERIHQKALTASVLKSYLHIEKMD